MVGALLLQGSSRMVPAERHMIASMLESERAPEPESEDLLQDIPLPGNFHCKLSTFSVKFSSRSMQVNLVCIHCE